MFADSEMRKTFNYGVYQIFLSEIGREIKARLAGKEIQWKTVRAEFMGKVLNL